MMLRLSRDFFNRYTPIVARELLGMRLVRSINGHRLSGVVVETEAYVGQHDTACHTSRGRTARTTVMFGTPGISYVYFIYGMHCMLNVVTEPVDVGAAVLFRAIEPVEQITIMQQNRAVKKPSVTLSLLTNGPARLTQALAIDRTCNKTDMVAGHEVWLEQGIPISDEMVCCGSRIGIDYATEQDRMAPWRYWVRDNAFVSRVAPCTQPVLLSNGNV